jgi:hypothetical protein
MRPVLPLLLAALTACGPRAERLDLVGLWGRQVDGEHEVWEMRETIDATGLTDVRPAFRRYRYPLDEIPLEEARGRWDVIRGDLVLTPSWSLDEVEVNRTALWTIDDFDERGLALLPPDAEEPRIYTVLETLPQPAPE